MRATLLNCIKLWRHCLIHCHQEEKYIERIKDCNGFVEEEYIEIYCYTCGKYRKRK
jgi:hypothetical protein